MKKKVITSSQETPEYRALVDISDAFHSLEHLFNMYDADEIDLSEYARLNDIDKLQEAMSILKGIGRLINYENISKI